MIDAQRIGEIFMDCLFTDDEIEDGKPKNGIQPVMVEGIISNFGFHPKRIKEYESEILEMLKELPHQFRKSEGGGWTFLNACNTETGEQWTGLHERMEQLFSLAIGLGKAKYMMPREMWSMFPGGMPYIQIDL